MKKKVVLLIDDDYSKITGHFYTYSKLIKESSLGCEVLEKAKIQELLNNLNEKSSNIESQKEEFKKWFLKIDEIYEIMAFIIDIDLETNPFNGMNICDMIKNVEIFNIVDRVKKEFFCKHIPKVVFTSKDDIRKKFENDEWIVSKSLENRAKFIENLERKIEKYLKEKEQSDILDEIYSLLKKIDTDVTDIKKNTKLLSHMIAKSLPQLTDKNKAKEIIDCWEQDPEFKNIIKDCKIKKPENLFNKLKTLKENLTDRAKENFAEMLYEEVTQFFESEAEIDEKDDRLTKFLKYSTYAVEKIGEVIHKK